MAKGHEEASTSQAGRKKGNPRETPTVISLVTAMFVEDLLFILPESSLLLNFAFPSLLW